MTIRHWNNAIRKITVPFSTESISNCFPLPNKRRCRPTNVSNSLPETPIPTWQLSCSNSDVTWWSADHVQADNLWTCKESGTKTQFQPGTAAIRSISTQKWTTGRPNSPICRNARNLFSEWSGNCLSPVPKQPGICITAVVGWPII